MRRRSWGLMVLGGLAGTVWVCAAVLSRPVPLETVDVDVPVAAHGSRWLDGVLGCRACHVDGSMGPERSVTMEQFAWMLQTGRGSDGARLSTARLHCWPEVPLDTLLGMSEEAHRRLASNAKATLGAWFATTWREAFGPSCESTAPHAHRGPHLHYGRAIWDSAHCGSCHEDDLPSMSRRTGATFARALRLDADHEGRALTPSHQPWSSMDDTELEALWAWVRSGGTFTASERGSDHLPEGSY